MSPVSDPRFTQSRWEDTLEKDRLDSDRAVRAEYLKPLVMLIVGAGTVMGVSLLAPAGDHDLSAPVVVLIYSIRFVVSLVSGVAGLWVAAKLWLGGAGPLGLAILRLAGIYAMTDLLSLILGPLLVAGWIITIACYVGMLAWLFDLEVREAFVVALITFLLRFVAGAVTFGLIIQAMG